MATLNFAHREITAKIVYYGPPKAGTVASVRALWQGLTGASRSELHAFGVGERATHSTLFSYTVRQASLGDFTLRLCVFSLPGDVQLDVHRREVLRDTDALIFVADARASRENANLDALLDAERALADVGIELASLPVVLAVNHTDSPDAKDVANVVFDLNPYGYPVYPTIATRGVGVREAHDDVVDTLIDRLTESLAGREAAVVITAVHEPARETEERIVARSLRLMQGGTTESIEASYEEVPAATPPSPSQARAAEDVLVAYQPRELAGARPTRVLGAELIDGRVQVDLLLERLDGGPHAHLRVVLDNRAPDTPAPPRPPPTGTITPTPGSATAHLPANIPIEEAPLEPVDLPGVWYGVAGVFGGLIVGLLLGFLVFA